MAKKRKKKTSDIIYDEFVDHGKFDKNAASCSRGAAAIHSADEGARKVIDTTIAVELAKQNAPKANYDIGDKVLVEDLVFASTFDAKIVATSPNGRYFVSRLDNSRRDGVWAFTYRGANIYYRILRKL